MKVTLATHGGLAAGIRRIPVVVESSTLPEPMGAELVQLVAALKSAPVVSEQRPGRARDVMTYAISVDEDGHTSVFRQSDIGMSEAFADLLTWLERHRAGK